MWTWPLTILQVWFQNRRAKVNRSRLQEQRRHDPFIYPICWSPSDPHSYSHHHQSEHSYHHQAPPPPQQQQQKNKDFNHLVNQNFIQRPSYEEHAYDSQSSVTSSNSSTPTLYPQLLPHMRPIDILALAAEYVQRCDEEKRFTDERRKCWRPWD